MEMSLPLILFLVFDAFIVLIVGIIIMHKQMSPQHPLRQMLETEAQARRGHVHVKNFAPRMDFPLADQNVAVWISQGDKNSPPGVFIEANWPAEQDIELYIFRENAVTQTGKKFGLKDISLKNRTFDEGYHISGSDPQRIQHLLDRDLQQALLALKDKRPSVEITKEKFQMIVPGLPKNSTDLHGVIDAAVRILIRFKEVTAHA